MYLSGNDFMGGEDRPSGSTRHSGLGSSRLRPHDPSRSHTGTSHPWIVRAHARTDYMYHHTCASTPDNRPRSSLATNTHASTCQAMSPTIHQ